ncbi:hypothetical protein OG609_39900 [Streptomyces sp. NBC_01224]|uniref:hypothetical protein n=1 Tax=unclassified Streptomyces TaxID=2593676 RepID=UPI002E1292F7|nr:hypothetical protein OG609_39900 [Streptomyces sp. NBC_01224]
MTYWRTLLKDAAYDAKVKKALATLDDAERAKLTVGIQKMFTDAVVWISVAPVPSVLVLNVKLTGPPASMACPPALARRGFRYRRCETVCSATGP